MRINPWKKRKLEPRATSYAASYVRYNELDYVGTFLSCTNAPEGIQRHSQRCPDSMHGILSYGFWAQDLGCSEAPHQALYNSTDGEGDEGEVALARAVGGVP